MKTDHPYKGLPEIAYWRPAVSDKHIYDLSDVVNMPEISLTDSIATGGSCFAQHLSNHLKQMGANYLDYELAPDYISSADAKLHGFGMYSCRYGNIYTVRQLYQLALESLEDRVPRDIVWEKEGRYYDALRPSVDPVGHSSKQAVLDVRAFHLTKVKAMLCDMNIFIFTLGITEAWVSTIDGTVYPTAPGTIAGTYREDKYKFVNFRYNDVYDDLASFWDLVKSLNPKARMILSVSPVPLTATASGSHILVASMQVKSTLRAVAGDFSESTDGVDYFPSYELVAGHPARGMFYNPGMRTINNAGVRFVLSHFFGEEKSNATPEVKQKIEKTSKEEDELICDEELLDKFSYGD